MNKFKILDIGASNFKLDDRWQFIGQEVEIILFEPDPRSFAALARQGIQAYNCALGSKEQLCKLNLTRKPACSSFLTPNMNYLSKFPDKERWEIIKKIDIETKPLDYFNLNVDFIKLDTQGTELDILNGATSTLQKVLGLEIEVSFIEIYNNQPLFGDICNFLHLFGFEFFDFITEYRYGRNELNRKGQLAFADALFLRPPEKVIITDLEKVQSYITIAKAYGKEDLIHVINSKLI